MHRHIQCSYIYSGVGSEYCLKLIIMLFVILEYLCALLDYKLSSIILLLDGCRGIYPFEPLPTTANHCQPYVFGYISQCCVAQNIKGTKLLQFDHFMSISVYITS